MSDPDTYEIVIKTHHGLEEILAQEAETCGLKEVETITRGVKGRGSLEEIYRCNLACNTALSVLTTVEEFTINTVDDLYKKALDIPWEKIFSLTKTFAIKGIIHADYIQNTQFPALRLKDAIADRFSNKYGERPNVEKDNPDVLIQLLIRENEVTVSMDTSGNPLNQRGYRIKGLDAPINEALAAGIIKLTGWNGNTDFYDPFCGSGTFLIEAALIAGNQAPNIRRRDFCLKNLKNFNSDLWFSVIDNLRKNEKEISAQFYANDKYRGAVEATRKHWIKPGLPLANLHLENKDFKDLEPKGDTGIIVTNPPYGKRITPKSIKYLYRDIGNLFKRSFPGFRAAVISGSEEGLKNLGLKPTKKVQLFNGPLEARLYILDMYHGSKKASKQPGNR